jgi:hypothetical protein
MRLHLSLLLSLLAAAPPLAAQMAADDTGWHVGGGVEAVRFGHVAVSEAAPGLAAEVRPSGRPAVYLSVGRNYRSWGFDLEAGWAGGHVEAGNDALSIEDRTSDVSRYRLAIGINRRVGSAGSGIIAVALAPTLDLWTVDGVSRVRAGAEGRLVLRVPLGAVELENRIGVGFSGSPIEATDIGELASLRGLRAVLVGVGLRFRTRRLAPIPTATRLAGPSQTLPDMSAAPLRSHSCAGRMTGHTGEPGGAAPQRSEGLGPYERSRPRRRRAPPALSDVLVQCLGDLHYIDHHVVRLNVHTRILGRRLTAKVNRHIGLKLDDRTFGVLNDLVQDINGRIYALG